MPIQIGIALCHSCTALVAQNRMKQTCNDQSHKMSRLARNIRRFLICFLLALLPADPALSGDLPEGRSFFDEFDFINRTRWGKSDGWTNGDWQNCDWSAKAATTQDGQLVLRFLREPGKTRDYLCGEIQTKAVYGHGTYEARIKTETGTGLNAAFFTYIGPFHGAPHDEIDIEILTRDTSGVSLNTYVSGEPQNGQRVALPKASDQGFQTYAFVWSADKIEWYVDGVKLHETTPKSPLPQTKPKIYFSFWGSDTFPKWMGPFKRPDHDLNMYVDWVAFTAEGEPCQFEASLHCKLD